MDSCILCQNPIFMIDNADVKDLDMQRAVLDLLTRCRGFGLAQQVLDGS